MAEAYGERLYRNRRKLVSEKRFASSSFHVGIGVGSMDFDHLTKRAVLVSDTLLLSHNGCGDGHKIADLGTKIHDNGVVPDESWASYEEYEETAEKLYMHCPDLDYLGQWLLDTEPLLRAGSAWYLPSYSIGTFRRDLADMRSYKGDDNYIPKTTFEPVGHSEVPGLLDFAQIGRRVVTQDDAPAIISRVVRPVINDISLPFLDGIPADVFSAITIGEFDAYRDFRSWLRQKLMNLDSALNAVESELELAKINEEIQDGIRGMQSKMRQVRRKRAVEVTGAVVGTVSASLVAVYGPALEPVIAALIGGAAGGGLWKALQATVDNSPRALRDNAWYYIWTLSRTDHSSML